MMTPRNLVAATPGGDITQDMIIGYLAAFQVPDAPVSTVKLRTAWRAEGLEDKLVPKARKEADTFMSACRSVETRRKDSSRTHEVKVDRVKEDGTEVVYQITSQVRDTEHREIEHTKAMLMVYNKTDQTITDEPQTRTAYRELRPLANQIRDYFEANSSKTPGAKVRAAIRTTLADQHATSIQSKGIFFVPKVGRTTLDSIENVMRSLYGDSGASDLWLIPVMADKRNKAKVAKHFEQNAGEWADKMLAEAVGRLKDDKGLRADRKANLQGERARLGAAAEKYQDLLDTKLTVLEEKMHLLDDALEQLLLRD
jgi:Family of unknown function (DUF6744)